MEFNSEQLSAIKAIEDFTSPLNHSKYLLLNGSAGTGKTTVICHVFNQPQFQNKTIAFSAPTNKAVSVMKLLSPIKKTLKVNFVTTHKIAGITRKIDEAGNIYFEERDNYELHNNYDFVIIDEASMVSRSLSDAIDSRFMALRTKIIYVGDKEQLPPVNESISKIFTRGLKTITLKKIERYKNSIVTYANSIRNNQKIKSSSLGSDVEFYKNESLWLKDFVKEYKSSVMLAYTNKKVSFLNNKAREYILGKENINENHIKGDKIVFNNYYNQDTNVFFTSQIGVISDTTSDHYEMKQFPLNDLLNIKLIDDSQKKNKGFKKVKTHEAGTKLEDPCPICYDDEVDELSETPCGHKFCTVCIILWMENNNMCPMCRCEIKKDCGEVIIKNDTILSKMINDFVELTKNKLIKVKYLTLDIETQSYHNDYLVNGSNCIARVVHDDSKEEYTKLFETLKEHLVQIGKFILTKSKNEFNKKLLINLWNFYYIHYVEVFADIGYGYAMTVHKSQGSTYENVYIHLNNIMNNRNELKQCVYTGITRASKQLKILK